MLITVNDSLITYTKVNTNIQHWSCYESIFYELITWTEMTTTKLNKI